MNWRRGLIFAVVHLCLAVPLILVADAEEWKALGWQSAPPRLEWKPYVPAAPDIQSLTCAPTTLTESSPDQAVEFDLVNYSGYHGFISVDVVIAADLPAFAISGWQSENAMTGTTFASLSQAVAGGHNRKSIIFTDIAFLLSIFLQWLVVGGRPLLRGQRPWLEPAWVITFFAIASSLLVATKLASSSEVFFAPLGICVLTWNSWCVIVILRLSKLGFAKIRHSYPSFQHAR